MYIYFVLFSAILHDSRLRIVNLFSNHTIFIFILRIYNVSVIKLKITMFMGRNVRIEWQTILPGMETKYRIQRLYRGCCCCDSQSIKSYKYGRCRSMGYHGAGDDALKPSFLSGYFP